MDYFLHFITNAFGEVSFGVMTPGVGFAILLTLVLLGLSGFASGAEIAFSACLHLIYLNLMAQNIRATKLFRCCAKIVNAHWPLY